MSILDEYVALKNKQKQEKLKKMEKNIESREFSKKVAASPAAGTTTPPAAGTTTPPAAGTTTPPASSTNTSTVTYPIRVTMDPSENVPKQFPGPNYVNYNNPLRTGFATPGMIQTLQRNDRAMGKVPYKRPASGEIDPLLAAEYYAAQMAREKSRELAAYESSKEKTKPDSWSGADVGRWLATTDEKQEQFEQEIAYYHQVAQTARNQYTMQQDLAELATWPEEDKKDLLAYYTGKIAGSGAPYISGSMAYSRLAKKYGKDKVDLLAESYTRAQNKENAEFLAKFAKAHAFPGSDVLSIPFSIAGDVGSAVDYAGQYVKQAITGPSRYGGLDVNTSGQWLSNITDTVRQERAEQIGENVQNVAEFLGADEKTAEIAGKVASTVHGAGISALENITKVVITGGVGTLALAATSGFSQAVTDATKNGANPTQAIMMGLVSGASEVLTEKLSLDNLLGLLKNAGSTQGFKAIVKEALKQGAVEMGEEELNFIVGLLGEAIILQEKSSYNQTIQELMAQGVPYEEAVSRANLALLQEAGMIAVQSALSGMMVSAGSNAANSSDPTIFADSTQQEAQKGRDNAQELLDGILPDKTEQSNTEQVETKTPAVGAQGMQDGTKSEGIDISDVLDETIAQGNGAPADPVNAAVESFESTGNISNKMATDILNSAKAVQQLVKEGSLPKLEGMTAAQKRQAVKTAVQVMVENKLNIDNAATEGYNITTNGGEQNDRTGSLGENQTGVSGVYEVRRTDDQGRGASGESSVDSGLVLLSDQAQGLLNQRGVVNVELHDSSADNAAFSAALDRARNADERNGWAVTPKETKELDSGNIRTFMDANGATGFAIASDGDIEAVFANKQAGAPKGTTKVTIPLAIANGGTKLDCYGEGLVRLYSQYGFIPVAKTTFNPDYANPGWTQDKGTPDIYFMMHNGDSVDTVVENYGKYHYPTKEELDALPVMDYDDAYAYRDQLLAQRDAGKSESENGAVGAAEEGFSGDLYRQIYEHGNIPEGENAVRPDVLPKSTDGKDRVSYTARTALEAKVTPEEFADLIGKETAKGRFSYMSIKNSETLEKAKKYIAEKGWEDAKSNWDKQVANGQTSAEMVVVGQLLYNHALQTEDFDQAMSILVDYAAAVRNTAQALQATRILKKLGLEAAVLKANNDIDALTEKDSTYKPKDGENFQQWKKKIKSDIGTLAGEIAAVRDGDVGTLKDIILQIAQFRRTTAWFGATERLSAAAQKVLNKLNFDDLKVVAETQLASIADDYRKRSKKEILQAIRKQNMLSSLKTILRNLTGNTAVGLGDAMSESGAGRMADFLLSKVTGKRTVGNDLTRAKQYFNAAKDAQAFASLCVELNIPIEIDSQASFAEAIGAESGGKYIGKTFRANGNLAMRVMYAFQKAMSYNLEVSDRIFEGGVNAAVQESLQKIKNSKLSEEEISRLADFTAKKRTYKDATWKDEEGKTHGAKLARKASDIVRPLGVFGDAAAPFVKVPMNVEQVGIDYTTGIVKGAGEIAAIIKDAKAGKDIPVERQRQAVSDFGRGLTGLAMIALFAGAAAAGILKVAGGEDWDKEALEQAEGRSGAQINWDALGRWLQGEGAGWKEGDAITSLDFLEPFNTQMYLGYELSKAEGFGDVAWAFPHSALLALMDSPMMTGPQEIGDLISTLAKAEDAGDVADAVAGLVSDYATSYIPQWMRQTAQFSDGYYRDTTGENVFQAAGNKFLTAIPGASQTLPMKYSGLGEPQQRGGFVSTFIDPTNTTKYNPNEITRELEVIYGQTNDASIYPDRQAPKSVTVNGEKIMISSKEMTESYQKTYGEKNNELYGLLLSKPDFQALPAAMQADLLKKAKSYAAEFAKAAVSDYEAPKETAQELTDKILGNAVVKQFTDAFSGNSAEGLDAAYSLYSGMSGDLRATVDEEGGRVGYFLAAKGAGVETGTFLELYQKFDTIRSDITKTRSQQETEWAHTLNRAAESGTISKAQADTLKDKMMIWGQYPVQTQKYDEMTAQGISADAANDITWMLEGLEPLEGKKAVAYWQTAEAIGSANISDDEKYKALLTYGNDTQDENLKEMLAEGYSASDYAAALRIYSENREQGGKGAKDRTIRQLRQELKLSKSEAEAIYKIYNSKSTEA